MTRRAMPIRMPEAAAMAAALLVAAAMQARDLPLGDAGDADPHTFALGARITAADVNGGRLQILEDGVDVCSQAYTWKRGYGKPRPILRPRIQDLSDGAGWPRVDVEPGHVAIDPRSSRVAFARANRVARPTLVKRIMLPNFCAWQMALRKRDRMSKPSRPGGATCFRMRRFLA